VLFFLCVFVSDGSYNRLIELALRMGNRLEEILDDNAASFTLPGVAHACRVDLAYNVASAAS